MQNLKYNSVQNYTWQSCRLYSVPENPSQRLFPLLCVNLPRSSRFLSDCIKKFLYFLFIKPSSDENSLLSVSSAGADDVDCLGVFLTGDVTSLSTGFDELLEVLLFSGTKPFISFITFSAIQTRKKINANIYLFFFNFFAIKVSKVERIISFKFPFQSNHLHD
jgi:hypothetical protein